MKTPTKPETRQVLLEQLRTAVCVQISLWDAVQARSYRNQN